MYIYALYIFIPSHDFANRMIVAWGLMLLRGSSSQLGPLGFQRTKNRPLRTFADLLEGTCNGENQKPITPFLVIPMVYFALHNLYGLVWNYVGIHGAIPKSSCWSSLSLTKIGIFWVYLCIGLFGRIYRKTMKLVSQKPGLLVAFATNPITCEEFKAPMTQVKCRMWRPRSWQQARFLNLEMEQETNYYVFDQPIVDG